MINKWRGHGRLQRVAADRSLPGRREFDVNSFVNVKRLGKSSCLFWYTIKVCRKDARDLETHQRRTNSVKTPSFQFAVLMGSLNQPSECSRWIDRHLGVDIPPATVLQDV